jgi:hypothetical protein
MPDQALVAFLRFWLPQLGLRWPGYRKVRGLVAKRLKRRLGELGLSVTFPRKSGHRVMRISPLLDRG